MEMIVVDKKETTLSDPHTGRISSALPATIMCSNLLAH
jgi:hypothetical protein